MAEYTKQRHRYVYWDRQSQGHIFEIGQDEGYCGVERKTLKEKAKEVDSRLVTVKRFRANQPLCLQCQDILRGHLQEQFPGWA